MWGVKAAGEAEAEAEAEGWNKYFLYTLYINIEWEQNSHGRHRGRHYRGRGRHRGRHVNGRVLPLEPSVSVLPCCRNVDGSVFWGLERHFRYVRV